MYDESWVSDVYSNSKHLAHNTSTYKGFKIEWDGDECASTLERPVKTRNENVPPKKKKDAPLMNRFQLLNMDGSEDGTEEDDNDTSVVTLPTLITPSTASVFA